MTIVTRTAWLALALCGAGVSVASAQSGRCDRACLIGVANQYIEALAVEAEGGRLAPFITLTTRAESGIIAPPIHSGP